MKPTNTHEPVLWDNGDPLERAWLCLVWGPQADGQYLVNVGNKMIRAFSDETLPAYIKDAIFTVRAFTAALGSEAYPDKSSPSVYYPPHRLSKEHRRIGWSLNPKDGVDAYMLVLTKQEMRDLRGELESGHERH